MTEQEKLKRLSIINVKNKLDLEEKYCLGSNIYVRCPFCVERNQSNLILNVEKDSYYCRNCSESGYAVGLYARCNYIDNKTAFKRLLENEADLTTSYTGIKKSERKSDEEISVVYDYLLKMLGLTKLHYRKLIDMGFTREEIIFYSFKSIPQKEEEKIKICQRLQKGGFDLSGIPRILCDTFLTEKVRH